MSEFRESVPLDLKELMLCRIGDGRDSVVPATVVDMLFDEDVTVLRLARIPFLSSVQVRSLLARCGALTTIDLTGCRYVTGSVLADVPPVTCAQLTTLRLSGCSRIEPAAASNMLAECTRLERLTLPPFGATEIVAMYNKAKALPPLVELDCDYSDVKGTELRALLDLFAPTVSEIRIVGCFALARKSSDALLSAETAPLHAIRWTRFSNLDRWQYLEGPSDYIAHVISSSCNTLVHLNVEWTNPWTVDMPALRTACIREQGDCGLFYTLRCFPNLEELELVSCRMLRVGAPSEVIVSASEAALVGRRLRRVSFVHANFAPLTGAPVRLPSVTDASFREFIFGPFVPPGDRVAGFGRFVSAVFPSLVSLQMFDCTENGEAMRREEPKRHDVWLPQLRTLRVAGTTGHVLPACYGRLPGELPQLRTLVLSTRALHEGAFACDPRLAMPLLSDVYVLMDSSDPAFALMPRAWDACTCNVYVGEPPPSASSATHA